MRDNDTKILEEKYDSIFAGKIEEEEDTSLGASEEKEEKEDKDEDKEEKSEDSDESKDEDSEDKDDDSDNSEDKDKDDDDDSEDKGFGSEDSDDSSSDSAGGDSGIQSKVKQLQKQYNDLLVDAFEKYAADCIENALDGVESSFGENITDILDGALAELKGKILGDLGVEDAMAAGCGCGAGPEVGGGMEMDLGGEPEVKFGSEVGGIPTISVDAGPEEGPQDEEASEEEDVEEEACGKKHDKEKKVVKESTQVASYYGFVD